MDPTQLSPEDIKRGIELGTRLYGYWKQIAAAWGGKKKRIMITGMEGVGKTTLFDYMTGKAYQKGYKPPATSTALESGKLKTAGKTYGLLVVPGQTGAPRWDAADKTILGSSPPDGIVHVVANGLATAPTRETGASKIVHDLSKIKSLDSLKKYQREREIDDLRQIAEWVRQAHRTNRKPSWLLLVVTKYDLFPTETELKDHYFPGGRGKIVHHLDELTHQIGSDNFRWQAGTACGSLEQYNWEKHSVKSALSMVQRDTLVEELVKQVVSLCADGGSAS